MKKTERFNNVFIMKKIISYLLCIVIFSSCAYSQKTTVGWECKELNNKEISNISVLSDCYGYVRYFYPNSNTEDFDWTKFLMYAVPKVIDTNDNEELKSELLKLFKPLCSQISFSEDSIISERKIHPPYYAIEHKAIGSLAEMNYGKNYSYIAHVIEDLNYNNSYCFKLKDGLYINIPIAINNLPSKTNDLIQLSKEIKKIDEGGITLISALLNAKNAVKGNLIFKQISYRIADIIIRKNIIQHFYPYFIEDGLVGSWNAKFKEEVFKIAQKDNIRDYYLEIQTFLANVKDSHIILWNSFDAGAVATYAPFFYPDISIEFVNDTCLISSVGEKYRNEIKKGYIVSSVNNLPISKIIMKKLSESSYSTKPAGLNRIAVLGKLFESKTKDSIINITIETFDNKEKKITLKTNLQESPSYHKNYFIKFLENGIIYINLCSDSCSYENFVKYIPSLESSKGIIFDVRGYPKYEVLPIISHFIKNKIELGNLLQPIIRFPNHLNTEYKSVEKWYVLPATSPESKEASKKNQYKEPQAIQINKPLIFLANEKNISFGETFIEMMKYYKVGSIVGMPTSGCNGDATQLSMPCATFFMTYNKFYNRDGSQHHSVGIQPDYFCEMKISDIRNNIDTQLEFAKEIILNDGKANNK